MSTKVRENRHFPAGGNLSSANFHVGDNAGDVQVTFVAVPGATSHPASTLAAYSAIQEYSEHTSELASWSQAYDPASLDLWPAATAFCAALTVRRLEEKPHSRDR
jgi:hypothetical protein